MVAARGLRGRGRADPVLGGGPVDAEDVVGVADLDGWGGGGGGGGEDDPEDPVLVGHRFPSARSLQAILCYCDASTFKAPRTLLRILLLVP